jgi:hypothetical protein
MIWEYLGKTGANSAPSNGQHFDTFGLTFLFCNSKARHSKALKEAFFCLLSNDPQTNL